jgi:hypothetical protein
MFVQEWYKKWGQVMVGILKVVDDKVFVTTEENVLECDRRRLISIAHGEANPVNTYKS